MTHIKLFFNISFLFCFFGLSQSAMAQSASNVEDLSFSMEAEEEPKAAKSLLEHLQQNEIVELELKLKVNQLLAAKKTNHYHPAQFSWKDSNGTVNALEIKVRPRGKTRRRVCDFPPLKLKFNKTDLAEEGFVAFKSLKLVVHCADSDEAEQDLLKEYLAYKIYNEITENSFRVQLVKINYVDSESGELYTQKYAFLLESTKELEKRLGIKEVDQYNIDLNNLHPQQAQELAVFQYMIGNADWQLPFLHNMKLFQVPNAQHPLAIPYDFDFSGLVNTSYAKPNPDFKQKNVRQRVYMGQSKDFLQETLELFSAKQAKVHDLVNGFDQLNAAEKTDLLDFVDQFYNGIKEKKYRKKAFRPKAKKQF